MVIFVSIGTGLGVVAGIYYFAEGWPAHIGAMLVGLLWISTYISGWDALELEIKQAGYTMKKMADGLGKKRWRIGKTVEPEWIAPNKVSDQPKPKQKGRKR